MLILYIQTVISDCRNDVVYGQRSQFLRYDRRRSTVDTERRPGTSSWRSPKKIQIGIIINIK